MSFFTDYLATAQSASSQTGVLVSVILAQWALETGHGTSKAFVQGNNFAGVSGTPPYVTGEINAYPNKQAGLSGYVQTLNHATYDPVRQASGWKAQCIALGNSPWATSHYEGGNVTGGGPGSALVTIIQSTNLLQYTSGLKTASSSSGKSGTGGGSTTSTPTAAFHAAYGPIEPPAPGFISTAATNQIFVNGSSAAVILGDALVTAQMDLALTKVSTITLTIHDPDRKIIQQPQFAQTSTLTFGPYVFTLVAVEKAGSVLTATYQPWVVAALQQATGPFTIAPGTMTRTQFAEMLVNQVEGAQFWCAPDSYLASLKEGYAHTNKEQLSRGTVDTPSENSWTCLQRLASEIQWVCFEFFGTVYFGPYSYLASQQPVLSPREHTGGITTITGTYDVGQPLGDLTITAVADSWTPTIGQCIWITNLGPFNGNWIVSEMEREDLEEPTITITCTQPLPSLPEPTTGGSNPAVGAGAGVAQSTGGKTAAQKALAFCMSKVGKAYVWGATGPTAYDCSGLVYQAYLSVGIDITRTTSTQWPTGAGARVPPGIGNLLPGDLLYFSDPGTSTTAQHVAMVHTVNKQKGTVTVVEAADPTQGVITTDQVVPTVGAAYGSTLQYLGAMRPAS